MVVFSNPSAATDQLWGLGPKCPDLLMGIIISTLQGVVRIGQDDVHDQTASDREIVGCEGATLVQQLLLLAVADSGLRVCTFGEHVVSELLCYCSNLSWSCLVSESVILQWSG